MSVAQEMLRDYTQALEEIGGKELQISTDPREEFKGTHATVTVVFKANGDVIFQLAPVHQDALANSPQTRTLLAEIISFYYGPEFLPRFSGDYMGTHVPGFHNWAILSRGLANLVTYNVDYHVRGFALYLCEALKELA